MCKFFAVRKFGFVHDGQPTVILEASFRMGKKEKEGEKEKQRKMQICNSRNFMMVTCKIHKLCQHFLSKHDLHKLILY